MVISSKKKSSVPDYGQCPYCRSYRSNTIGRTWVPGTPGLVPVDHFQCLKCEGHFSSKGKPQ